MKRFLTFLTVLMISFTMVHAQTAVVPCGGELTGAGGTGSLTVGQSDFLYTDKDAGNIQQPYSAWEGVQQVYPYRDKVYDTICPGVVYASNGFNIGPFVTPGLVMDTLFVASVVNAMNDPNIHAVGPDTIRVLYLTIRSLHTSYPEGSFISVMAGHSIPNNYHHILGNGADSASMVVSPANPEITNLFIGSSFTYGSNPLTQSGTYYVTYTTIGAGCPISFTDTIQVADSLLCSIVNIVNDNSCATGYGEATVVATGGSGNYSYTWSNTSPTQTTTNATGLIAGTYVVTVTDLDMGYTATAEAVVPADPFFATLTVDDAMLCPGESTTLTATLTGGNTSYVDYEFYLLGKNSPFADDYGASSPVSSTTISPVGNEGDVISYVVKVADFDFCEIADTISITLACEGAPTASNSVTPPADINGDIHFDDNLQIVVYNPVWGDFVDTSCPLQYSINGGPWMNWTNTNTPISIYGNDIFVGQVTFDLRHDDNCSMGKTTHYSWTILPGVGDISYTRDLQEMQICMGYDSLRLTNLALAGFDPSKEIFQWSYEYALHNGTQSQSAWYDLTQLGTPIVPFVTPNVPVNAVVSGFATQPGDTIRIHVRVQETTDGGNTWSTIQSTYAEWLLIDNPSFDVASLQDASICENQVQLFNGESSTQGTLTWSYGVGSNYSNVQPVSGSIPEFNYAITSVHGATLSMQDFNNIDSLMAILTLTPANISCPAVSDTAYLHINQLDTLFLISDPSTLSQEFCIGKSLLTIEYGWGGGATSATVTWTPSQPAGVNVNVNAGTLEIVGTPTVSGTYRFSVMTNGSCSHGTSNGVIIINDLPTFNLTTTDAACYGEADGAVGVELGSLIGIESDYFYSWTDANGQYLGGQSQLSGVGAGTYTVEVSTNSSGCMNTATATISEPATAVSASLSQNDMACYGDNTGSISITANGGTAPYEFYVYDVNDMSSVIGGVQAVAAGVSKTIAGLVAGNYIVYVIDANQCIYSDNIAIAQPVQLAASIISQQNLSCYESEDGALQVSANGGTAPYNYLWSNGESTDAISDLAYGLYMVTVTDGNNCTATVAATITRPAKITADFYDSACESYTWNGISYTATGDYVQHITTAAGCDSVVTLHLTILNATYATVYATECTQYTWPLNNMTYTKSGQYTDTLVNAANCDSIVTLNLTINAPTSSDVYENAISSYLWPLNNKTYTASGVYADTLFGQNANGCDSIVYLHLTIAASAMNIQTTTTDAKCYGDKSGEIAVIVSGGNSPYAIYVYEASDLSMAVKAFANVPQSVQKIATGLGAGNYVVYVHDSLGTVNSSAQLTINEPAAVTSTFTVSECNSYVWAGTTYTQSQQDTKVFQTADGCDSTVTMNLTIFNTTSSDEYQTAILSYLWPLNNKTYTASGVYADTLFGQNVNGCDSIVYLHLTINSSALTVQTNVNDVQCNGGNDGEIEVTVNGGYAPYTIYIYETSDMNVALKAFANVPSGAQKVATGLAAGTYVIVVRDSLGTENTTSQLIINEPAAITSTFTVSECNSYVWAGTTYTQSQQDVKVFQTAAGCDSTVTMNLTIFVETKTDIYDTICAGHTYTKYGFNETTAGLYTHNFMTSNGCDSIVNLYLYVNAPITVDLYDDVCQSTPYNNYGFSVSSLKNKTPGNYIYTQNLQTKSGCDSIVNLHLTVNPTASFTVYDEVCHGEVYIGMGFAIKTKDSLPNVYTYVQNLQTSKGCDSVVTLKLTVRPDYNIIYMDTICAGQTYTQYGFNESTTGIYTQQLQSVYGCDSVVTLNLFVKSPITADVYETACGSYFWNLSGKTYTQSGVYVDTTSNATGCDSIVTLHLTINMPSTSDVYVTDCATSYYWPLSGQTYVTAGTYSYTIANGNAVGCDSVVTLHLSMPQSLLNATTSVTNVLCNGASTGAINITANGGAAPYSISVYDNTDTTVAIRTFANVDDGNSKLANNLTAGSYKIVVTDDYGCSFTTAATITENSALVLSLTSQMPICNGESNGSASVSVSGATAPYSYSWSNGQSTQSISNLSAGYYMVTVQDYNGCTATAGTTIAQPAKITSSFAVTDCDSYLWNGVTYSQSGSYTQMFVSSMGCDSVVTMNLTITNATVSHTYVSTCVAYSWHGQDILNSGEYVDTIQNSVGCDSIMHLHLTINKPTSSDTYISACDSFVWNGTTYTASGDYFHEMYGGNANGCDSTAWLHLTIYTPTYGAVNDTACVSYVWAQNGETYTQSGDYTDTIYGGNSNGCDSIITLHLVINNPTSGEETVKICESYVWPFNGLTYTQSGDYTDTIFGGNSNGCDTMATLHLTITHSTELHVYDTSCVEYRWDITNETYTETGDYEYQVPNGNAAGCDSTIILHLVINQPSMEVFTVISNQPYHWDVTNQTYEATGEYSYTYYGGAANGCDSTIILRFQSTIGIDEVNIEDLDAAVFPNPTNDILNVTFDERLEINEGRLYDMYGKLVKIQKIESDKSQIDMSTLANGVYLLRLYNGKTTVKTFKVVKH
ncbi:MAG: T9SS type A sorting domain-containing protein [Bacteroidales bacterium]|nr:T9SS type A sorting domain-containing protein [Bacteroidales bacterium]